MLQIYTAEKTYYTMQYAIMIVMMILFILILLSFCELIKVICIILAVVIVFSIIMCLKLSHAQTRQNGAISFFTALRLLTLATERPSVLQ